MLYFGTMNIRDLINEAVGFQTRKSWESETRSDMIERKSRDILEKELEEVKEKLKDSDQNKAAMLVREIASWRIKEIRQKLWDEYKAASAKLN